MSSVRLIYGDAISTLRDHPAGAFDAVVTDPPYTAAGGSTNGRTEGSTGADDQFFAHWFAAVWAELRRVVKPTGCGFVFCDWRTLGSIQRAVAPNGNRQKAEVWRMGQALVWDRESIGLGSPFRNSFEMIAFVRGPDWRSALPRDIPTVIRHKFPYGKHEHHGAEKPVELVSQLLRWALPNGGHVVDPFAGSGTTGIAARGLDIESTLIEGDATTHERATARLGLVAGAEVRALRLASFRCPDCGADVEWRLHNSAPGSTGDAACGRSARAYMSDAQLQAFDSGNRCEWHGRVRRLERGLVRLENR